MQTIYLEHLHPRHWRDTWWLDTLRLVTARTSGGWALQGCYAVGPCNQALGGARGQHRHRLQNLRTHCEGAE